jgi:hypothetical protein
MDEPRETAPEPEKPKPTPSSYTPPTTPEIIRWQWSQRGWWPYPPVGWPSPTVP